MADTTTNKAGLKVIATTSDRLKNLTIVDGQLIFLQDLTRIAFDFKGQRKFYNQITEVESEALRTTIENPLNGYYFVIDTAILWHHNDGWTQITEKPSEIVFVGDRVDFPELGQEKKLYVDTTSDNENISVWNEDLGAYVVVADKTQEVTNADIESLFK